LVRASGSIHYQQAADRSFLDTVLVRGDLTSNQLEVQTPTLRSQIRNIAAHYTLENGDVTLKDFRASLLGGELTSSGTMSSIDGNAHSKFNAQLRGIQLAAVNGALKSSAVPKGVSLGGGLNAEANAAWGKTFDDVVAHVDASVNGKVSGNAQVIPLESAIHSTYTGAHQELALKHHVPIYGNDGKTGETLVKTVLAPMFRARNLEVLSWEGFNILGGGDGRVLDDPRHKRTKLKTKGGVLAGALGYAPHAGVRIEYVPSLGNWKTAWDFVHFRGFLGTKMSMQFTWQGCDSILAAPLVLDLVRLTEFAQRKGEAGPMTHLASFFKDPLGVAEHSFAEQFRLLTDYVARHARNGRAARKAPRTR